MSTIEVLHSSESMEWYTPHKYCRAVREVLGGIELDPASCFGANENVCAIRYFTSAEDGLKQEWKAASVYCNPPYGYREGRTSNQDLWIKKIIGEYEKGNFSEGILLVNACPYLSWFKPLWNYPICFTDHKIKFDSPYGGKSPTKGNAFVYFGSNPAKFAEVFQQFGKIVQ